MFGIGSAEFLLILIVALVVLGPDHLPKIVRTFSKVRSEFRKVSTDLQRAINVEAQLEDVIKPQKKKSSSAQGKTGGKTAAKTDAKPKAEANAKPEDKPKEDKPKAADAAAAPETATEAATATSTAAAPEAARQTTAGANPAPEAKAEAPTISEPLPLYESEKNRLRRESEQAAKMAAPAAEQENAEGEKHG